VKTRRYSSPRPEGPSPLPRILFVKTSSLGDIVHNCPAISDVARHARDAVIDWVVEESFAEIAALHASVRRVIPIALRRWRGALLSPAAWSEAAAFRDALRGERYDAIIDSQGLIKSALVGALALGRRHGFDRASVREPLATLFYDAVHPIPTDLHAVERNRRLAGAALGYVPDLRCDYGLRVEGDMSMQAGAQMSSPYALLLTMTSRRDKLWPEERWRALVAWLEGQGVHCVLPWGTDEEHSRCTRIATAIPGAVVPQRMPLTDLARLARGARCVIGVDTGLTHLAAALDVPALGLYCGSNPLLTGLRGNGRVENLGAAGRPPGVAEVQDAFTGLAAQR
jgi:heptosyltransferase I